MWLSEGITTALSWLKHHGQYINYIHRIALYHKGNKETFVWRARRIGNIEIYMHIFNRYLFLVATHDKVLNHTFLHYSTSKRDIHDSTRLEMFHISYRKENQNVFSLVLNFFNIIRISAQWTHFKGMAIFCPPPPHHPPQGVSHLFVSKTGMICFLT